MQPTFQYGTIWWVVLKIGFDFSEPLVCRAAPHCRDSHAEVSRGKSLLWRNARAASSDLFRAIPASSQCSAWLQSRSFATPRYELPAPVANPADCGLSQSKCQPLTRHCIHFMVASGMFGHELTIWTIRLALVCYVVFVSGNLATATCSCTKWAAISRWVWTAGCGLFLAHVLAAFAFHHHWSHASAWETTAAETDAMLGVRFGDGIYFSYVFLVLWVVDVGMMWWLASRKPQPKLVGIEGAESSSIAHGPTAATWLRGLIHAYLFFIAFNGAIVFESGPSRWGGIIACILLAALAGRAGYNWMIGRESMANLET
jgi:hypothetical protein